jgi:hypothetical protein
MEDIVVKLGELSRRDAVFRSQQMGGKDEAVPAAVMELAEIVQQRPFECRALPHVSPESASAELRAALMIDEPEPFAQRHVIERAGEERRFRAVGRNDGVGLFSACRHVVVRQVRQAEQECFERLLLVGEQWMDPVELPVDFFGARAQRGLRLVVCTCPSALLGQRIA